MNRVKKDEQDSGASKKRGKGRPGVSESDPARRLRRMLEDVTTTGEAALDKNRMKEIKKICKSEPDSIPFAFEVLLKQLAKKHAQVRLSTLQVIQEIFDRSHAFRELVIDHLKELVDLTFDMDGANQLPPPASARQKLSETALNAIQGWKDKYGAAYKKLEIGYEYLKRVKGVAFDSGDARPALQRRREQERRTRSDAIWRERAENVKSEMSAEGSGSARLEAKECLTQLDACLALLIPPPDLFDGDDGSCEDGQNGLTPRNTSPSHSRTSADEPDEASMDRDEDSQEAERVHGIVNRSATVVTVDLSNAGPCVEETSDNAAVVQSLRDQYRLLTRRLLPLAKRWTLVLGRAGCDGEALRRAVDAKRVLEDAKMRAESLGLPLDEGKDKSTMEMDRSSSDDDDDLIEVEEKPGYEDQVVEPESLQPPVLASERPAQPLKRPATSMSASCSSSASSWRLGSCLKDEETDPTSAKATLKRLKLVLSSPEPKPSTSKAHSKSESSIPKLPFDVDLYNWEDEKKPQKVLVDTERLRWWGGGASLEDTEVEVPGSDLSVRNIEFAGSFKPVTWSCRAPLPSGRLCPRKDRVRCPLHGQIVGRDLDGQPTDPEVRMKLEAEEEERRAVNPDWQDPALLADIKAATGVDLKIPKKGERRKGRRIHLAPAKEETPRDRLQRKLHARSKRVAAAMDAQDRRRRGDRFADQFNYIFER